MPGITHLIVTEYNPGLFDNNQPHDPPDGWQDWFNRTHCWVRHYLGDQVHGLLYFVDEPNSGFNDPNDEQWLPVSLRNDDNRRDFWLQVGTNAQEGPNYDPDNGCQPPAGGHIDGSPSELYASIGDIFILPQPNNPSQIHNYQPETVDIGGIVTGTLGVWGYNNVYYVTSDLEVPVDQTLTIVPSTSLVFDSGTQMNVEGQLLAKGNSVHPIRFLSTAETGWNGIHFEESLLKSECRGCYIENLAVGRTALQVNTPITLQDSLIRGVPGGTAISNTVSLTLSNVLMDYVGIGLHISGVPTNTYNNSSCYP